MGKAARLSIYWLDAVCRLVIPLRQVALAQLNKYHHQSGNAASGKLVWNQHKYLVCGNNTLSSHLVGILKRVTLVYFYHVNCCGHHKKLSIAKLDFVQVCGLSLSFYNSTLRKFYKFSDSRETWTSPTLQSADWPISRHIIGLRCAKECLILKYKHIQNPWYSDVTLTASIDPNCNLTCQSCILGFYLGLHLRYINNEDLLYFLDEIHTLYQE